MSVLNELKSKLSAYLLGTEELDGFRSWFADVVRYANKYDEATQQLIWSVDREFASVLSGRTTRPQLRENLNSIAESIELVPDSLASDPPVNSELAVSDNDVSFWGAAGFLQRSDYEGFGFSGKLEYTVSAATQYQFFPWGASGNNLIVPLPPLSDLPPQKLPLVQLSHQTRSAA
jgi:hypothetical protein